MVGGRCGHHDEGGRCGWGDEGEPIVGGGGGGGCRRWWLVRGGDIKEDDRWDGGRMVANDCDHALWLGPLPKPLDCFYHGGKKTRTLESIFNGRPSPAYKHLDCSTTIILYVCVCVSSEVEISRTTR
jgi:hypothetical protein